MEKLLWLMLHEISYTTGYVGSMIKVKLHVVMIGSIVFSTGIKQRFSEKVLFFAEKVW